MVETHMTATEFWAYVQHADSLVPPVTLVGTVIIFLSKAVRKFIVGKAGEIAGIAAASFLNTLGR